jgi:hypothetical protein
MVSWDAITAVAEIVGLLVLIASVFYLARQVAHTNLQTTSESLKDATQLYAAQYEKSFGTEENTAFMRKALNNYSSLSQDEQGKLFSIIIGYVGAWDNLHSKFKSGFLEVGVYNSITMSFSSMLQSPGGLTCIHQIHENFTLPPHIMANTKLRSIAGHEIRPYVDCLDFLAPQVEQVPTKK